MAIYCYGELKSLYGTVNDCCYCGTVSAERHGTVPSSFPHDVSDTQCFEMCSSTQCLCVVILSKSCALSLFGTVFAYSNEMISDSLVKQFPPTTPQTQPFP